MLVLSILGILFTLLYMGRHKRLLPSSYVRLGEAGDIGSMFGGGGEEDNSVQTISTLDAQQSALEKALYPYLAQQIQQGGTKYSGQFTAGMSPQEQTSLQLLSKYLEQGQPSVTTQGLTTAEQGLKGMSPSDTYANYMQYTYPQMQNYFETQVLPQVKEQYVGTGTYQGSPQYNASAKAYTDFGNQNMTNIANAIQNNRNQAYSLVPYLGQLQNVATQQPLQQAAAGQAYGALPRNILQGELSARYTDWLRNNPDMQSLIGDALNAMGITTQMGYQNPPNTTKAAGIGSMGNILSALIGSGIFQKDPNTGDGVSKIYTGNNFGGTDTSGMSGFNWSPTTYDYSQYGV